MPHSLRKRSETLAACAAMIAGVPFCLIDSICMVSCEAGARYGNVQLVG